MLDGMTDPLQALVLGALQGITELFPISSLGHTVLLPGVLGWSVDQSDPAFLAFLVATHFATALVLLAFYAAQWLRIVRGMLRSLAEREVTLANADGRLGWLLVLATIPAGLAGLLFQDQVRILFASPRIAAAFLVANGVVLLGGEALRRRAETRDGLPLATLPWWRALAIGAAQVLALVPGFSRTGVTMSGGLVAGLAHPDAARFAFLLATPIIFAASVLKLPEFFASSNSASLLPTVLGMVAAAVCAYASVRYLTRYFTVNTLRPFAIYCIAAGALASVLLGLR